MAFMRKKDLARSMAESEESIVSRMPVASRDWTRRRGNAVVLLNAVRVYQQHAIDRRLLESLPIAGVTQSGSLNNFVSARPNSIEATL